MPKKIIDIITEARLPKIKMPQRSAQERMYQHHQELRKKAGLPDESYYEKMAAQKKKELEDMKNEDVELDEAVTVSHERYARSHSKQASGRGRWLFTHKRFGDVDYQNDKETHSVTGSFTDAKKSAKEWAKKHGHQTAYVMEEVELVEASMSDIAKMAHDLKTAKEKHDVEKHEKDLASTPIRKPNYNVVVHHTHEDGTKKDYTYRVTKANNDKHAQNIAMLRHHEKFGGGNFKSDSTDVTRLNEGDEHLHKDYIEKSLADSDINASVEGNTVRVHPSNTKKAARLLKNMGYEHKVVGGLKEAVGVIREVVKKKVDVNGATKGKTATGEPMPKVEINPESKVV